MNASDLKISPTAHKEFVQDYREALENPEARSVFLTLCNGSEDLLQAFTAPRVGIGTFARLMDLPVTTVRHWVEFGLVHPWNVNGKFHFTALNVQQVESVKRWQALGLTLEDIAARLREQGEGVLVFDTLGESKIQLMRRQTPDERERHRAEAKARRQRGESGIVPVRDDPALLNVPEARAALNLEYTQVIERLEQQKLEIEHRIVQAQAAQAKLQSSKT